jgi:hypothetical protein
MEKTTQSAKKGLSSPHIRKDMSFGDNKTSDGRQIRETITLTPGSWVGIESKGLIRVNSSLYNLKYYDLIGSDSTQKEVINKALTQLIPHTSKTSNNHSSVDFELKQLDTLTSLAKKFKTYCNSVEKLRGLEGDKKILLERKIIKDKILLSKYLKQLKQDSSFSIQGDKLVYSGEYVQATKIIGNLGGF